MSKLSKILWGAAFIILILVIIALFSPYKISTILSGFKSDTSDVQDRSENAKKPSIPQTEKTETEPSVIEDMTESETVISENAGSGEVDEYKDLEYAKPAGQSLKLDLFVPKDSTDKPPLLVWIHGGGWIEGSKSGCPYKTFAKYGYSMACIDYRLASMAFEGECKSDFIFPAQIYDVKAAVRWLRENADTYGYDPDSFAAIGFSSGGHLAALLGTSYGVKELEGTENPGYSDEVQAVVDYYGPVDVTQEPPEIVFTEDPCKTSLPELNTKYGGEETPFFYWTRAWGLFLGGSLIDEDIIKLAKKASPLTYIDPSDPPFIVFHGKNDGMIPDEQSKMLVKALQDAGVDVTFVSTEGDHNYGNANDPEKEVFEEFLTPTLAFLDKYLKGQ